MPDVSALNQATPSFEVDLETARIAHDAFRDAFAAESARHSNLVMKTQTLTTVATILFASLGLSNFTIWPSKSAATISFVLGIVSIWWSLNILLTRDFKEIAIEKMLEDSELLDKPQFVLIRAARSYDQAIKECRPIVDGLYQKLDKAVIALKASAVLALLAFVLQSIMGRNMGEDNKSNQGAGAGQPTVTTTSGTESKPSLSTVTAPYGVQTVKKSLDKSNIQTRTVTTENRETKDSGEKK